jgi:BlaI family transcriptional regulator, penicillinase repressor
MKKLTTAEELIMQALWKISKGNVAQVIEKLPKPKPHYNTVSTIIKILIEKKFVDFEAIGRNYFYYPLISKENYAKQSAKKMLKDYFKGGVAELLSFFVKENDITLIELEQLMKEIKSNHANKKK